MSSTPPAVFVENGPEGPQPLENMAGSNNRTLSVGRPPERPTPRPSPSPIPPPVAARPSPKPIQPRSKPARQYPRAPAKKPAPAPEGPVEVAVTAPKPPTGGNPAPPGQGGGDELVQVGAELGSTHILATGRPTLTYLLVEARSTELASQELPLNLSLVIDTSGSMKQQRKLDYAIIAVEQALARMRDVDICSLIVFASGVAKVLQTPVNLSPKALSDLIRATPVGEGTNLYLGLDLAVREVGANLSPDRLNHVIMLTDGETQGENECLRLCAGGFAQGISFTAIGLGRQFKSRLLKALAENHNGRYYALDGPSELPAIYDQELKGVRHVVVRNNRLVLVPEKGVRIRRAHRLEPRLRDLGEPTPVNGEIVIPMGDLSRSETLSVLFEVSLTGKRAGLQRVATARVENDSAGGARSHPIDVRFTTNRAETSVQSPKVHAAIDRVMRQR